MKIRKISISHSNPLWTITKGDRARCPKKLSPNCVNTVGKLDFKIFVLNTGKAAAYSK